MQHVHTQSGCSPHVSRSPTSSTLNTDLGPASYVAAAAAARPKGEPTARRADGVLSSLDTLQHPIWKVLPPRDSYSSYHDTQHIDLHHLPSTLLRPGGGTSVERTIWRRPNFQKAHKAVRNILIFVLFVSCLMATVYQQQMRARRKVHTSWPVANSKGERRLANKKNQSSLAFLLAKVLLTIRPSCIK